MDVGGWLRGLGLGQYEEKFRDNKIDADLLPRLTVDDLKDIGVSVVGDRRRLLDAIAVIAGAGPASPTKTAPSKGLQAPAERRPITVMFCDLVGSTSLAAKLDAEDWRNIVNVYLDEASAAVTGLGGHVLKKLGDGLMALFGYPHAQENDAERAVRAALAIQRALVEINARNASRGAPELSARIGLDSGQVVVDATGEVFGEAPNVAARVQAAAEPGSVLVTGSVQRQIAGLFVVEDKGAHELKGVAQPLSLYRVVRASGGGRRGGARALTTFIGREEELGVLARRWDRARTGEGQLVLIVGEPGLGKSRLIEEFHAQLAETPHTWVEWSASQLLQNTPLHPIAEWGRQRFGVDAPAEQRLSDLEDTLRLIGLDPAEHAPLVAPLVDIALSPGRAANFPPEELRRRQLAAMTAWVLSGARSQPVVLAFEDLHWADPTSLDLLRAFADRGAQTPLLLLATTRPEFRPAWSLRSHHSLISLSPLDRAGIARMVGEISARHALSKEVIEGVSERTGGVPLFVEEVTRLLVERSEQGGVQAIPPTLQQSLAARLDRLGPAREIAQIGAVLGRDFAYSLLRDVAELEEPALQASLDRLADADLLFVEGAPPEAKYRFKHALIQDAAYDSLLKSRRQALHRRAAEALVKGEAEPEAIAHHFTEAGLDDLAIEWWGKAGDQALRRSAFQEAIAHLGKAIAMADRTGGGTAPGIPGQQLHLRAAYGNALFAARGPGATETTEAFARARESVGDKDAFGRLAADYGLWVGSFARGELSPMRAHAATFLSDVEARPDSPEAGIAHRVQGATHWFAGEFLQARQHIERALALFQPGRDDDLAFRFGIDAGVGAMLYLALTLWPLGDIGRAISLVRDAEARSASLAHIGTRAHGKRHMAMFELMRGDPPRCALNALELARLTGEHDLPMWGAWGVFLEGLATAESGMVSGGLEAMRRGAELLREQNVLPFDGLQKIVLAEAEARAGDVDRAVVVLDEALATCERTGHRAFEAELHRVRGRMLLKRDPANAAPSEEALQTALAIAKEQGARSWGLRAALSLAKLYQSTGHPYDAHAVLAPALEGFSPTPEMREIAEGQALLAQLAETDEVKGVEAQRRRMTQLQAAYGTALIAARGFGAPETTEAFARARESAAGDDSFERLAADYGLWVGSYVRGDLPSMKAQTAAFLVDVAATPDSGEAGIAHRVQGMTHLFAGEFVEARRELKHALALFRPGRDDDLAVRFPPDPGAAAMIYLAFALWALGEFGEAASLMERMRARVEGLSHATSLAHATALTAFFALMRGDRSQAGTSVSKLAQIVRDHELPLFHAIGEFLAGWVTAGGASLVEGVEAMRRGIESIRRQNAVVFDGIIKIALAKAEVRVGDPERALAVLDEALATCDRTGHSMFGCEIRRARGELLLNLDPSASVAAEESLQAAIAIAKQQGARSYELLASLSLAKLYQSTARAADAHAVLAPALEGFAPTPEMQEIAEAQALLATLVETDDVKAEAGQRRRRLALQTSYGRALLWAKGFAAEETKAAFVRVQEIAGSTKEPAARVAIHDAECLRTFIRGEYCEAQEIAETMLREAGADAQSPEAGAFRCMLGLIRLYQGELTTAQTIFEQELTEFQFRPAGHAKAAAFLALTEWHLGKAARARQHIQQAVQRAGEVGDVATVGTVLFFETILESRRDDASATRLAADALLELSEKHGMRTYLDEGRVYANWARGRLLDPDFGADKLEQALAAYTAQGNRADAPSLYCLLAELQGDARGPESALASIDQGLAIANETGEHFTDPYLHRLRGEMLLKRNRSDPAPAEEAFKVAMAMAKAQGARSYELLASLPLAKLYQSTARPAEAHAVLAPALEGFAPTPEMPEIAEAMSLSARLA
jgi:class 3 adenylate cyclase/predicted ATPase